MAADITYTIDGDTGGLMGAVKSATKTMKDFGLIGGPPILAVKTAVAGVEKAFDGMKGAAGLAGRAMKGFAEQGKGAVALLNQINGAVELANKVIPALTFPLAMAENADKAKEAFGELETAWQGVAGALGEGINDALIPILRSAGVEMGKLKEKAREIGQGIGDAIDFTRVSYQMGSLGEILGLSLQKVLIQFGAGLLNYFLEAGAVMGNLMEQALVKAEIGFKKLTGIGSPSEPQAKLRQLQAEARGPRPVLPMEEAAVAKVDDLNRQIEALRAPVKDRIDQEKMLTQAGEGLTKGFNFLKAQFENFMGTGAEKSLLPAPQLRRSGDPNAPQGPGLPRSKGGGGSGSGGSSEPDLLPPPRLGKPFNTDPNAWQGPMQGDKQVWEQKAKEGEKPGDPREGHGTHRIRGAGFGKGSNNAREGLSYFNGSRMAGISTPRLDAAKLGQNVTNKTGISAAAKQEQAAQQKDDKAAAAMEAVLKTLPSIAEATEAMKEHLSKIQSR